MATVSLNMIVKDEVEQVLTIVEHAFPHVDEINLTVSDKSAANKLRKHTIIEGANVKWREWNDRFDDARNANFAMATTDYCFWIDADDFFDFSTLKELVALAEDNDLDEVFLPYNYSQDENGNTNARHYRERLVKRGRGEWKGWVHETYIIDNPKKSHVMESPEVRHMIGPEHAIQSQERNHRILAKAYEATKDPRYLMYLGGSFFSLGEYEKAITLLLDFIPQSGNPDDVYRALCFVSESAYHLEKYELAYEYATKAMVHTPAYPQAYWHLAQYAYDQKQYKESLEWVKVSIAKPDPKSLTVWDPSGRERAILVAAQAEFMLKHYNNALAWLRKVPNNPDAQELLDGFTDEADAETFIKMLPRLRKYFYNDESLYQALVDDIKFDERLVGLRKAATVPTKWPKKSIAIFCGEGYEEWGPHTMEKGMGGSEEAVIYLSRELSKQGYKVTVYGEVDHLTTDTTVDKDYMVTYRPWRSIDWRDEFDVFVAWRNPAILPKVKARVKLADIHDVIPASAVKPYPDVTYMFKTDYHKGLYGDVDSAVVGNGIVKEQFHED